MTTTIAPVRESPASILEVIDHILDKGLVINADIVVSLVGVELLGIKIRAAVASFATAAKYGLEFPSGADRDMPAWREALASRDSCPQCRKEVESEILLGVGCPWCGWRSARSEVSQGPLETLLDSSRSSHGADQA